MRLFPYQAINISLQGTIAATKSLLIVDARSFHQALIQADFHGSDCLWMQIKSLFKKSKTKKLF